MTTTAHEDQFTPSTQTIEIVHAPYEPVAILKRNVAELELALKRQTERAEKAEVELARLREQKPVAWCDPVEFNDDPWSFQGFRCRTSNYPTMPLYASPVPAPHKGATHCDDCGLTWLDDGLNPLGCPYCKTHASERNASRYLALRKVGVQVPGCEFVKFDWSLDAAADRLPETAP